MRTITTALLLISAAMISTEAQAEVHRCTDADGNMVFSQFPCAEEPAAAKEEEKDEAAVEEVEAEDVQPQSANIESVVPTRDDLTIAQCKKPYRDAIDAIEARMVDGYTADQGEAYKKQLLGLTKGLRRCET